MRRFEPLLGTPFTIVCGGENFDPRGPEALLFRHPSVGEVAVVGLPGAKWGEQVRPFCGPSRAR